MILRIIYVFLHISFLSYTSQIYNLLEKLYCEDVFFNDLDHYSFSSSYLSGAEQLKCILHIIPLKCPSSFNLIIGDFLYYASISIPDEIKDETTKGQVGKLCSIGASANVELDVEHKDNWNTLSPFCRLLVTETNARKYKHKGRYYNGN